MVPGYEIGARLHRGESHSVFAARRTSDGLPVVLKTIEAEYPERHRVAALRREFDITRALEPVPAVVRALELLPYGRGNVAIVFERLGSSLADEREAAQGGKLPLERVLAVGMAVAEALGAIHEREVVHKNVEPRTLLVDEAGAVRLVDLGIASELTVERQNYALARRLEGSLPYISPEQTGRMNRDLDYRSDYYSLGVTLFELVTGQRPFEAESALEWVHAHISRPTPSASDVDRAIPSAVSDVLRKLMAKNAENRYQSSFGIAADLAHCLDELVETGTVAPFPLGRRDVGRRLHVPQVLYGRGIERTMLLEIFDRVAAGATEICMVSGFSGVGKSALVGEVSRPLVHRRGTMAQGKFDQFQRATPYSAVAGALRGLAQQWLAEPEERARGLRDELLAALGPNAGLLLDLAPELGHLLGPQPRVPDLPPTEAQNRFHLVFSSFVRVVARERPFVLFLDDLQFGDAATLALIRRLATTRDLPRFLLLGAFRSNEVDFGHPLRLTLDEIAETRTVHELRLEPLDGESVDQLVADTLRLEVDEARDLARLLQDTAEGNPFFLIEMLKTLERERAIWFSNDLGRWRWDLEAVRKSGLGTNVVDFVVGNLKKLPPDTQHVLRLAACIGNTFDLRTLAVICARDLDTTAVALEPALRRHLLVPLHADYKLVGRVGSEISSDDDDAPNPSYRFQHDRVQQAAYALIDPDARQAVHLSIGRSILHHGGEEARSERLMEIVGHLDEGRRLIDSEEERLDLARLNLDAALRAQRASSYETALRYLEIGEELLPDDRFDSHYALAMAIATERQQCAYLTARYEDAEAGTEALLLRARTPLEKAEILSTRTRQYATIGKMAASIEAAIAGLRLLGVPITEDPDRAAIDREIEEVERNLGGRAIAALIDAPVLRDPADAVAIRLLMEIFPAAFLSGSGNLFPFLVLRSVNISLRSGNSPESAFAYAAFGMLLCGALGDPARGLAYGKLAVAMNDRFDDIALKSRVIYVYAMFIHHWSHHWASMTPWFRRGIESGYQSGDLLYLAYSAQDCIIWDPRMDLETAEREHAAYLEIVRECEYQDSLDSGTLFLQMQRNFLGRTSDLLSMNDATFDEERCLEGMRARRFMTGVANYHIYKTEIACLYGRFEEALPHVRAQDRLMASSMSLPQLVRYHAVSFQVLAGLLPRMGAEEAAETLARLRADRETMRKLADHCPENFLHLVLTMDAELARLDGRADEALSLYDAAADAARQSEFLRDEAVANELAGRHLLALGRRKAAEGYLRAAASLFERWGARRKVSELEAEHPRVFERGAARRRGHGAASEGGARGSTSIESVDLDFASLMKASQAISSELVLENLWTTTMRVMLENAGAQRGCFVVRKSGRLAAEGYTEADASSEPASPSRPLEGEGALALPLSVVHHVLRTHQPVVLHDATEDAVFGRDAYVARHAPRSVLCVPLVRSGKSEGVVYVENGVTAGAFTEDRIEILKLLAAQASISIENARLYEDQTRLVEAQRRFVPSQFLESLDHRDIANVDLGEHVAKTMSVMFADIRGFMPLAERLGPRMVIQILNRYFGMVERPIDEAGGFIDSYAGDEIKVLFDAAPDAALRAGIGMWRALEGFNERAREQGQPELQIGIGANTGPVVLGTVGAHNRIQCSVLGDTVNLASRIEQLTKVYRARFLVGEHTVKALRAPRSFELRLVDRVAVKGRHEAVEIHEVLDAESPERRAAKLATRPLVTAAMEAYLGRRFDEALEGFGDVLARDPDDAVPGIFVERCHRYLREPPANDWQGFERLLTK